MLLIVALATVGCGHVNPAPFEKLHQSTAAFDSGTDAVLAEVAAITRDSFKTPSPFGTTPAFSELMLTWEDEGDPTVPSAEAVPLHAMIRQMRRGSAGLNGALSSYTELLFVLASGGKEDAERVQALAEQANQNLRSARDALNVPADDGQVALFTTITAELFRQKIEYDRRKYLRESMDEASPAIQEMSEFMVATMDLLANDLAQDYVAWVELRRRAYEEATDAKKHPILIEVLDKNDATMLILDSIRAAREGYRGLPIAHDEVRASLDQKEPFLGAVARLYGEAKRLEQLHHELEQAESETPEPEN